MRPGTRPLPAPRSALPALLAIALVGGVACRAERTPVAHVGVEPAALTLPYPGSSRLDLTWEPASPLGEVEGEPRVFVHLVDGDGRVARTFDHPLPDGWEAGARIVDPVVLYQSALGPPLAAGEYGLTLGLYDPSGRRWPLAVDGEDVGRLEYRVARVTVRPPGEATFPELLFAGGWQGLRPGSDRQILGRRGVLGDARVVVGRAEAPARLVLHLEVAPPPAGSHLQLAADAAEPGVRVTSDCDGSEHLLVGDGAHRVAVAVPAGDRCEVRLVPNFRVEAAAGAAAGDLPAAQLSNVFWQEPAESG